MGIKCKVIFPRSEHYCLSNLSIFVVIVSVFPRDAPKNTNQCEHITLLHSLIEMCELLVQMTQNRTNLSQAHTHIHRIASARAPLAIF